MKPNDSVELVISVVLCTHNRVELLANVLQTLCEQSLDKSIYEILVIDNNSVDRTHQVTQEYNDQYNNIRYYFESKNGLSHARNRGWQEAKGQYIAYLDDDSKVPKQWLKVAKEIIEVKKPDVFGGPYFPFYNSQVPNWWKDSYESFNEIRVARPLEKGEYLRGGNLFIGRDLLEEMGGFNSQYGMAEKKIAYGEETDLQIRIRANKPSKMIYYDPRLFIYHLVRPEKMKLLWGFRSYFISGRYSYQLFSNNKKRVIQPMLFVQVFQTIQTFFSFCKELMKGIFRRDRNRYPYIQNYFYENIFQHVHSLGLMYERYKTSTQNFNLK